MALLQNEAERGRELVQPFRESRDSYVSAGPTTRVVLSQRMRTAT